MIEYNIKDYHIYTKIEFIEKPYYKVAKIKYCLGPVKNIEERARLKEKLRG